MQKRIANNTMLCRGCILLITVLLLSTCTKSSEQNSALFNSTLSATVDSSPRVPQAHFSNARIGLSFIPRNYDDSKSSWAQALRVADNLGVQVLQLPAGFWRENEPAEAAYHWGSLDRLLTGLV